MEKHFFNIFSAIAYGVPKREPFETAAKLHPIGLSHRNCSKTSLGNWHSSLNRENTKEESTKSDFLVKSNLLCFRDYFFDNFPILHASYLKDNGKIISD